MRRLIGGLFFGLAAAAVAHAHALYLLPVAGEPTKVTVVFSDDLAPDERVKDATWEKVNKLKLEAVDAAGKRTPVPFARDKAQLNATVPAGTTAVVGALDYGTFAKGDAKPRALRFYPKAVVTGADAATGAGLEVVAVAEAGKVRFRVLAAGKPVAAAKASVMVPEKGEKEDATTDEQGLTPAFAAKGRYGVTVRHEEAKGGEAGGVKYETTLHVATLVVDVK